MNNTKEGPAYSIYSSKYTNIYKSLIEKRQREVLKKSKELCTESHHIIPKSLGGTDDKTNLIRLTAREHFVAHFLLARMYKEGTDEWYKMHHAVCSFKMNSSGVKFNSRLYAVSKEVTRYQVAKRNHEIKMNEVENFIHFYEEWRISGDKIFTWYEKNKTRISYSMRTVFTYITELEGRRTDKIDLKKLKSRALSEEEIKKRHTNKSNAAKLMYINDPTLKTRLGSIMSKCLKGKKLSEEHKTKISDSLLSRALGPI